VAEVEVAAVVAHGPLGQGSCGVRAAGQGAVAHGAERGRRVLRWRTREGHEVTRTVGRRAARWTAQLHAAARRRRRPCAGWTGGCDNREKVTVRTHCPAPAARGRGGGSGQAPSWHPELAAYRCFFRPDGVHRAPPHEDSHHRRHHPHSV